MTEKMDWDDVLSLMDDWVAKAAEPARDLRRAIVDVPTHGSIGAYYEPWLGYGGVYGPAGKDQARVKQAAARTLNAPVLELTLEDLTHPCSSWIKVAYSPTLRSSLEAVNFFPGHYPGGLPNHASPLASMLTSGVLGAGLGYGGGKLLEQVMPEGHGRKLGRTGALLGAAIGAAPGLAVGGVNKMQGYDFNDKGLLEGDPDRTPLIDPGIHAAPLHGGGLSQPYLDSIYQTVPSRPGKKAEDLLAFFVEALDQVPLGKGFKTAVDAFCKQAFDNDTMSMADGGKSSAVDINAMGQTLWQSGASPQLAASTMGTLYAAQQMPDEDGQPGWATGNQMGQLARNFGRPYQQGLGTNVVLNAVKDYALGSLGGAAWNTAVGSPYRASTFGLANAGLGLIGAVVSKMIGG